MSLAVQTEQLSKRYRLGSVEKRDDTLFGSVAAWVRRPLYNFRRVRDLSRFADGNSDSSDVIWALKDVSCDIKQGDVVGLIGRNGAGKSTLLKVLARIVEPTSGRGIINGRVSSLLEVGTGFHPDLTGRDNVYLNGVILGMSKVEMDRKFDEIVSFSGVERFIDTPVKRYSSGMQVRLAFSVAAHLEADILLIDEVLAVGDATFQQKCMGKMDEVARGGRTILFVSHNQEAVRQICQRALLFEDGRICADGPVDDVAQKYLKSFSDGTFTYENKVRGLVIDRVVLRNAAGEEVAELSPGEDLRVEVHFEAKRRIERPYFTVGIHGIHGPCFAASMLLDGQRPAALDGRGVVACTFKAIPLLPQNFSIRLVIRAEDGKELLMKHQEVASLTVTANLEEFGFRGAFQTQVSGFAPVIVPYEWTLPDGTVAPVSLTRPSP